MRGAEHLGNVLVLGLGKSGKSVARYCVALLGSRVDSVFIAAGAKNEDSAAFIESLFARCDSVRSEGSPRSGQPLLDYAFGDDALASDIGHFDLCIASPGIPFWHDLYVRGAELSDELISEVEFAWRESDEDSTWVAITGTNGKTTTTSLAAHVLKECGFAADAVGNIGDVCLDAVVADRTQVYVAEVSSYQLFSTRLFAPDVAVMLNITPDHIHWHKTLEAYRDAKFQLLDNMTARFAQTQGEIVGPVNPVAILDAANDVVRAKVRELKALSRDERGFDYIPMGTSDGIHGDMRAKCGAENAAFLDADDVLHVALDGIDHVLAHASDLQIQGEHNASNALAAAAVAVALGANDAAIAQALCSFKPLEHRIEPCGTVAGVACYNDSKATNVDATLKALAAFPDKRVVILLGGDDKGTDLSELVDAVFAHADVAVCYGEGGPRFAQALEQASHAEALQVVRADHMEDALEAALQAAKAGDVVLLSPACASFDEFRSFEHRGDVFKQLVAAHRKTRGA